MSIAICRKAAIKSGLKDQELTSILDIAKNAAEIGDVEAAKLLKEHCE